MYEEVKQRKVQRKERKDTEAAKKARGQVDLDAKEVANKAELFQIHTAHSLKYIDRADNITRSVIVADTNKEYKVPFLKELMYYFYGMKKGVANSMKNPELIELFEDNVTSFTEGNKTSE